MEVKSKKGSEGQSVYIDQIRLDIYQSIDNQFGLYNF